MPILWVILAAFFTFNLSLATGAMEKIKNLMVSLSADQRIQVLLIAWGFGSFLEAAAGFGTAVAIPASILITLGFPPFMVVVICLIANTVAVAFGVVGIPVTTLAKITALPVMPLTLDVAIQLTPFVMVVPFLVVFALTKRWRDFNGIWLTTFLAGASFAAVQYAVARFAGPELAALLASLVSCGTIIISAKLFPPARQWRLSGEQEESPASQRNSQTVTVKEQIIAWSPYILLLFLVLGTSKLVPAVNQPLSRVASAWPIYHGPGGKPFVIDWLLTPGTLIMVCAVAGGLIQGATFRELTSVFKNTFLQFQKTFINRYSVGRHGQGLELQRHGRCYCRFARHRGRRFLSLLRAAHRRSGDLFDRQRHKLECVIRGFANRNRSPAWRGPAVDCGRQCKRRMRR